MKLNTKFLKTDLLSGMVVFLVALPLCLGIAVASGAPPFAGIITGVIGGIVVGFLSGSNVSVSGLQRGLLPLYWPPLQIWDMNRFSGGSCYCRINSVNAWFCKSRNYFQLIFHHCVIEGMLVAIGIIIIKKEIPHAIGYDKAHEGDFFAYEKRTEDQGFFTELIQFV